jgi:hypothetical protein
MPLTSSQLTQKAAGYMLAAANANSRENKAKKTVVSPNNNSKKLMFLNHRKN